MDVFVTDEYRRDVREDLELQIRWIKEIPAHQFPGWQNAVWAMERAAVVLGAIVLPAEKKGGA